MARDMGVGHFLWLPLTRPLPDGCPLPDAQPAFLLLVSYQWKALLMLMLGCEDAALRSHQLAFTELLRVVRIQLQTTLGARAAGGGGRPEGGGSGEEAPQETPFGLPMIEELLPDSFLRKIFGSFFQMMQVRIISGE